MVSTLWNQITSGRFLCKKWSLFDQEDLLILIQEIINEKS